MKTDFEKSIANIKIVLSIVLIVAILFLILAEPIKIALAAETSSGSDVLDDLHIDSTFDESSYPKNSTDYSLQFIQIAETIFDELLVYVYVPSGNDKNIFANMIRFALNNEDVKDYNLTLLSSNGVFHKYKVEDYCVDLGIGYRAYNIIQLTRKTRADLGDTVVDENNNTIHTVPYAVGKTIGACYVNNNLCYSNFDLEVVQITDKYVGQLRYDDGFTFKDIIGIDTACMSHYIVFNTDKDIDKICDITVSYSMQRVVSSINVLGDHSISKHEITEYPNKKLTCDDVGSYDSGGILSHKFTWKRIETVDEFIQDNTYKTLVTSGGITEEGQQNIKNKKWVVRFAETAITSTYNDTLLGREFYTEYYEIDNTTILWLTFETNGVIYSLGCVDNHSKGDGVPDNWQETDLLEILKLILVILGFILIAVIIVVLAVVIKPIGAVLKFIGKLIWAIISAPFKFIAWLFGGKKKQQKSYKKRSRH